MTRSPELAEQVVVDRPLSIEADARRVLVTNDDGVESAGIARLADALARHFDVTVAAPARDWSGAGTAIGHFDPAAGIPLLPARVNGHRAFSVDGPPGLAVMAAALGAFGDPFPIVVSGINSGINTGQSVIHSGTVGAALTARTFGAHGVAVSLSPPAPGDEWRWDTAAEIAAGVVRWLVLADRRPTAINVNVPSVARSGIRGARSAPLDKFGYFRVAFADEGTQKLEFEVSDAERETTPGSDTDLLRQGFVTITRLEPMTSEATGFADDVTEIWDHLGGSI